MGVFTADNACFSYMGRVDFSDNKAPLLIYAGSNIKFRFAGSYLKITVVNVSMGEYAAIGAVLDGVQQKLELTKCAEPQTFVLGEGLSDGEHEVIVFKRQAAAHYFRFISAETDGELIKHENKYELKLEYYGDSVSAGEVTEAIYYEGQCDPINHNGIYDNSYFSYTWSLARKLNAEFYNNSQGGLALFDKTGYFAGPELETMKGLEFTYNKLSYVPYAPVGISDWDFGRYTPDIVIFAIGQNDANPNPDAIRDADYATKWKSKYKEILLELKKRYDNPKFILITTVLMHDGIWDNVLDEICSEINSPDVTRYRFRRCGAATHGHPRVTEQEEMAIELETYIRTNLLK